MVASQAAAEQTIEIVTFNQNLDASVANDAKQQIQKLIDAGRYRLALDFEDVQFVDSSGLSVLVAALKAARAVGGDVVLVNLKPEVQSIVELTRLHRILEICSSREEAVAKLSA